MSGTRQKKAGRRFLPFLLLSLGLWVLGFAAGYLAHRNRLFPAAPFSAAERRLTPEPTQGQPPRRRQAFGRARKTPRGADLDQLAALGYLDGYEPAHEDVGIQTFERELAYKGYNLYTTGHAPEAILMQMDGEVVHRWRCEFEDVWPGRLDAPPHMWRRVHLFENGDLLALFEWYGLIKLDRDSNLIWAKSGHYHHDFEVARDGRIYVLSSGLKDDPRSGKWEKVREDFVEVLDAEGEVIRSVSLLAAFDRSIYAPMLDWNSRKRISAAPARDLLHTNTLEILDGRLEEIPAFKAGNVLISGRELNTIAVVDLDSEEVVWAMSGMWRRQHQPTMLDNGNMLIFDNMGASNFSRIIEYDPRTQEIAWMFEGNERNGFSSPVSGSSERLPNGNTLITESTGGRAFEVTSDQRIVWDFVNPARGGENGDLVAVIFELLRVPPEFPLEWLRP